MAKKGLAVFHSSDLQNPVHKLMDDGVAVIGKDDQSVTLKGDVNVTVQNYEGQNLSQIINSIKSTYEQAVSDEATARANADIALQSNINAVAGDLKANTASLTAAIATEEARIDAILDSADADKDSFVEIVSLINSVDTTNDNALGTAVTSLATSISDGDASLTTRVSLAEDHTTQLDEMLYGEGGEVDSIYGQMAGDFAATMAVIAAKETASDAADTALQGSLDAEVADRKAAVSAEATARAAADTAEAAARSAADATLTARLEAEVADRKAAVTAEATVRADADASLTTRVGNEEVARGAADSTLQANIDTEAAARADADNSLSTRATATENFLASVHADRQSGDASLTTRLTNEENARVAAVTSINIAFNTADTALQANIDTEAGRIDAILAAADADKDSFVEIVSLINAVDATNDDALAAYVLSNNAAMSALKADVDQNEADSDTAEASLTTRVSLAEDHTTQLDNMLYGEGGEVDSIYGQMAGDFAATMAVIAAKEAASDAADTALQGSLDAEVADRKAAVSAEATARAAADATLQSNIDTEIADRKTAVSGEAAARSAADAALQAEIDALQVNFKGGDMTLSGTADLQGDVTLTGTVTIPKVTDVTPYQAGGVHAGADGMMFYLDAADDAGRTGFEDGHKWYFCEGGVWYPSPWFTE